MACRQLIQFPAKFRDGDLLPCTTDVLIDCSEAKILGEKTDKAWDAAHFKFERITGFFIAYKGIEYGATDWSQDDFLNACKNACNENINRIHVGQFAMPFV